MSITRNTIKTTTIACRIPLDVWLIILRRAKKQGIKPSEYVKRFLVKDCTRRR
jgi:hypothetical protein